jgi:hypothetical protein
MTEKTYYIENSTELEEALEQIEQNFPCFVDRELIEMDYSKVTINAREEDIASIERMLAPLV